MKRLSSNFFTYLILFIIFIGVILYTFVGTYSNDDWWTAFFLREGFWANFLDSDQGLVWSHFLERFFTHSLPNILNIHPQQNIFLPIIKGLGFSIYITLLSLFFNIEQKKVPNPIVLMVNSLLVFSIIFLVDYLMLTHVNQFFKYLLNLIIGASIWFIWIKEFLEDKFLSYNNIVRDCYFIIIIVFSGHLVNIPTLVLFTTLWLYTIFKTKKYKHCITLCIPFLIIYSLCMFIYMNLPGFTFMWFKRLPAEPILQYSISHFGVFTKEFFIHTFNNQYIYGLLLITILGLIGMIINRKKIPSKYFIVVSGIFMANFAFQYSLLTCGATYYDDKSFWFVSLDVTATFLFYLVLDCNVIYGCLYRSLDKKKFKIALIVCLIFAISIIYPFKNIFNNAKDYYYKQFIQREAIYKLSKVCRFYSLTSDVIYMPLEYYKDINILAWMRLWEWDFVNENMAIVYNFDKNTPFEIINEKIINEDKLFSKEELEQINFKKLYDDNFILQMEPPKYHL